MTTRPRAVIVAGPTATGKSALGLAIAERFNGVVVNADSIQCYRDLSILTARPTPAEEARAPHRLFGFLDPAEILSAAAWAERAAVEIRVAHDAGQLPILVGGTGLYLLALTEGLADIPPIPDDIRTETRTLMAGIGVSYLHRMLAERDPETAARLSAHDSQRVARAWEVLEATGQSISWWQAQPKRAPVDATYCSIVLLPPRDVLYAACDARFTAMMGAGALDQMRDLLARGVTDAAPLMRALGARELAAHLLGASSLAAAVAAAQAATRHYAKRQNTWFKHQFHAQMTIQEQFSERLLQEIFNKIGLFVLT
ncbi:MAG: tRNA (adenosine(37)-N6)-dimethylallyltransferase MiaA [Rhodospirillaceae bacterium]|nr:tRNA (adenosine(37)-N6)-dimethylallyltransferase MiaA [Rhodospirillaceae bacterium]